MKYCKKCGAELPESAVFCEKCGNPVGGMQKQGNGKKKWILAISSGVIILAVATVGVLFAMGVIGGKDDVVQTDADATVPQGVSSVTGEAVSNTEELEGNKQKDALENSNSEDMEWEAYVAYKAYLDGENEKEEDSGYFEEGTSNNIQYAFLYLDEDDYPELVKIDHGSRAGESYVYTYKKGEVSVAFIENTIYFYQEKRGIIYGSFWNASGMSGLECIYEFESQNSYIQEKVSHTIEDVEGWSPEEGRIKLAKEIGIESGHWSDIECKDSLEEAYIRLQHI